MKISREDVLRVAELAQLELSAEEAETYRGQLDSILTYIDKLKGLDLSRVEPMAQVTFDRGKTGSTDTHSYGSVDNTHAYSGETVHHPELRDDTLWPCETASDLFGQAPSAAKPFFRVPRVIDR